MKHNLQMKWLAVLAFALSCICASAQSQVKGHVYDSAGEPLIGAYVTIEGTTTGSITDIDGAYVITAKPTDVLKAEYMGFTPATEIAELCSELLPQVDGTYMQMEDELASIGAVIGASAAGKKAMTVK